MIGGPALMMVTMLAALLTRLPDQANHDSAEAAL